MPVRALFIVLLFFCSVAHAGIQLATTRMIYPADKREVTLTVTNTGTTPRLLQAWLDDGEHDKQPQAADLPFIITPPVFRLDPGKGQALRVHFIGGNVSPVRESVYWINVLEVQPRADTTDDNSVIQFPTRSRIKLFYRPTGLAGTSDEAINTLRWQLRSTTPPYQLECENPSAFNVSFAHISLNSTQEESGTAQGMCPAKGRTVFTLNGPASGFIYFTTINDYGGMTRHKKDYRRE